LAGSCCGGIIGFFSSRFSQLNNAINKVSEKQDRALERQDRASERHEERCDKLYEMFIDLLKDKKNTAE